MSRLAYASLSLLAYTYAGYPALVAGLARLRPLTVDKDETFRPKVSVLIPVHNAARYVAPKLESLLRQTYPRELVEILVYSDGATDGSDLEVERFADKGVTLVRAETRKGKPTALNAMRKIATGEVLVLTDIRQVLSDNAIAELVSYLADESVGCVSGNLVLEGATGAGFYWRYENFIRASEARFRGMVGVTGPLYALRARDLPEVPEDLLLDDMYIPLKLRMTGKRLVFSEKAVAVDDAFEDDREKGRKVRTLAGNFQLLSKMPELLSPLANPSFFEMTSHKVLRLAGPVFMAGAVVGAAAGFVTAKSGPQRAAMGALLLGEALFAGLAMAGGRAGKLGQLARTFVVLNTAAVEGFVRFVKDKQEVTW